MQFKSFPSLTISNIWSSWCWKMSKLDNPHKNSFDLIKICKCTSFWSVGSHSNRKRREQIVQAGASNIHNMHKWSKWIRVFSNLFNRDPRWVSLKCFTLINQAEPHIQSGQQQQQQQKKNIPQGEEKDIPTRAATMPRVTRRKKKWISKELTL